MQYLCAITLALALAACTTQPPASRAPTDQYPITNMVDPVTGELPNVIIAP